MTEIEKRFCIDNILEGLEGNHIPYTYDKCRKTIYIGGTNVTKLLFAACEVYVRREEELYNITREKIEAYEKCLKDITYMYDSGLYRKNELAFARCIVEAEDLLKE